MYLRALVCLGSTRLESHTTLTDGLQDLYGSVTRAFHLFILIVIYFIIFFKLYQLPSFYTILVYMFMSVMFFQLCLV